MAGPNGEFDYKDYEREVTAPSTSSANYDPTNVAPLIEGLAGHVPTTASANSLGVAFKYSEDLVVRHPGDKDYGAANKRDESPEQAIYEAAAKQSERLRTFQDSSPANLDYFN